MRRIKTIYRITLPLKSRWCFDLKKKAPLETSDSRLVGNCIREFKTKEKANRIFRLCPSGTLFEKWIYTRSFGWVSGQAEYEIQK